MLDEYERALRYWDYGPNYERVKEAEAEIESLLDEYNYIWGVQISNDPYKGYKLYCKVGIRIAADEIHELEYPCLAVVETKTLTQKKTALYWHREKRDIVLLRQTLGHAVGLKDLYESVACVPVW